MTTITVIAIAVVAMAFVAGNKNGHNHFMGSSTSMMFGNQMA